MNARPFRLAYFTATCAPQVIQASTASFAACLTDLRTCLDTMPVLVALGAEVTATDLIDFTQKLTLDERKRCLLDGVSSADSPFAVGMTLTVAIETAAQVIPGREKRILSDLQDKLDELLHEVLERLPHFNP